MFEVEVFCMVTLCRVVVGYQCFQSSMLPPFSEWRWNSMNLWNAGILPQHQGVTIQKPRLEISVHVWFLSFLFATYSLNFFYRLGCSNKAYSCLVTGLNYVLQRLVAIVSHVFTDRQKVVLNTGNTPLSIVRGPFERFVDWRHCAAIMQRGTVIVTPSCSGGGNLVVAWILSIKPSLEFELRFFKSNHF
jgi:hypothetical protein